MQNLIDIANEIEKNNGTLYLVGGSVRDELLGKVANDEDYVVVGLNSEQFQKIFREAIPRGKSFEVYDLDGKEFAMARTETKIGVGHKEFEIKTGENISLKEDLARRDITINAIAKNFLTGEIIDPFNGIQDLKDKIIRATTSHFSEDPLRVYRIARFAAQLQFDVEERTIDLMKSLKDELNTLSKERVFTEFRKALATEKPSIFFETLKKAEILDIHFKEINNLIGSLQPEKYHPEGDSYNHTMMVVDESAKVTDNLQIRYACLVHDLGKGTTPKKMYPHHYGHDIRGVVVVNQLSQNIGVPKSWEKCGKIACKEHMIGGMFNELRPKKKIEFIERVSKSLLGLHGLQIVVNSDRASFRENNVDFEEIGFKCLNEINGEYIKRKYKQCYGIEFNKKLQEERIKWIKKI